MRRSEKMGEDTAEAMEAASAQQRQWAQEKAAASLLRVDIDNPEIDTRFIPKARSDEDGPSRLMTTMQNNIMTMHSDGQRLSDAQAQDEHEADELSKLKRKSAGGRPKKAGSEMLLDATTLLRSRKTSLEQKVQSTKNLIEEIWKEVHRTFPQEIPPDLQVLYTAVEKEHTEAAAQMDTHIAALLAVDPQKLVEAATCAQDLRQSLAGISKNEIQAANKAFDSAVQSLRKGLINATNGDKGKTKQSVHRRRARAG